MKDIHSKAQDKANQHVTMLFSHPSGFPTDHFRMKEVFLQKTDIVPKENELKTVAPPQIVEEGRILRIVAYCCVSMDDSDLLLFTELQKNAYHDMICANPKWKYVETYADAGFSRVYTHQLPAFKRMMKDAMAGKIDMIITKSINRFGTNLLDCIGWVRELKDRHDPPIAVYFEQEHLNTLNPTSNIILFTLAMTAEEKSRMLSGRSCLLRPQKQ